MNEPFQDGLDAALRRLREDAASRTAPDELEHKLIQRVPRRTGSHVQASRLDVDPRSGCGFAITRHRFADHRTDKGGGSGCTRSFGSR